MVLYVSSCPAVLPLDIWRTVLGHCDQNMINNVMKTNKSMLELCSEDQLWNKLAIATFKVKPRIGKGKELFRYFKDSTPVMIPVTLKYTDASDWGMTFRCELMLKPEGVFCTATGVVRANVTVSHPERFLLTEVRAKGAGWGFSSPLKKFSVSATANSMEQSGPDATNTTHMEPYTLDDPTKEQTFKLSKPLVAKDVLIKLIEGAKKDENIDTEYVFIYGHKIPHNLV